MASSATVQGKKVVDVLCRVAVDDRCQDVVQIGCGVETVELCDLDQGGNDAPVGCSLIRPGEESILAVKAMGRMARSTALVYSSVRSLSRKQVRSSRSGKR